MVGALKKLELWQAILIAMVLGIATGFSLEQHAEMLQPLGTMFVRLIKMIVVPLVIFSLIDGVTALHDPKAMGRMGLKTFLVYMGSTVVAISLGVLFGELLQPGANVTFDNMQQTAPAASMSVVDTILNVIPTNPIEAMVDGNMLQIICFALLMGVSLSLIGDEAKAAISLNRSLNHAMIRMTEMIMWIAPIGVFGLMAWMAGTQGLDTVLALGQLVIAFGIAVVLHVSIVYLGTLYFYLGLSPLQFLRNILDALMVAFSTSSSAATLPVTMEVNEKNNGISNPTASFVLPLGATINMDGTALYLGLATTFIAQAVGVELTLMEMGIVVATTTLASIGTAGTPSAGLVMMTIALDAVGLSAEAIGLILGIDRILDMVRTTVNVTGDSFVAMLIDNWEGRFDKKVFLAETH